MGKALEILKKHWGHSEFRESQEAIINAVMQGKDVFAQLPTGSGKSVCYQVPTMMCHGICIVISPLIALMEDQVASLKNRGIKALALTSKLNRHETVIAFDNLRFGGYKFLYLSPEKLQSPLVQEKLSDLPVCLIAVDEAHCISQWGHDFRPAYQKIAQINTILPGIPRIALTATATKKVREDIVKYLELKDPEVFLSSYYRSNVSIRVKQTENLLQQTHDILCEHPGSAIVYMGTRKDCLYMSEFLNHKKLKSTFYHGGLAPTDKTEALRSWMTQKYDVIVATNAFGMGIDKPDVRVIVHAHLPLSLENYIQEIGRAGRDGKPSNTYLLYNDNSLEHAANFLKQSMADHAFTYLVYKKLQDFFKIATGELPETGLAFDLSDFCSTYGLSLLQSYAALQHLEQEGVLLLDQDGRKLHRVQITSAGTNLVSGKGRDTVSGKIVQALLRNYGGIIEHLTPIQEGRIAKKLGIEKSVIVKHLQQLSMDQVIRYEKPASSGEIRFLVPREDNYVNHTMAGGIRARNLVKKEKARAMVEFVNNPSVCRNRQLQLYFGESDKGACGNCDVCLRKSKGRRRADYSHLAKHILHLLGSSGPMGVREISVVLETSAEDVAKTLGLMMEKGSIGLNLQNKFHLRP